MGYTWTDSGEDSTYTFTCVRCHKDFSVTCKLNEKMAYASGVDAQNAFKSLDAFERECIISGQCFDCQEEIFHRPTKMHAKSWGDRIGECCVCGTGVYEEKDRVGTSRWRCNSCSTMLKWNAAYTELEESF